MAQGRTNAPVSEVENILRKIYPVGSVYINTVDINPATILGFGTWQRVASNVALWGASADGQAGTTKAAGLPNIWGSYQTLVQTSDAGPSRSGALNSTFIANANVSIMPGQSSDQIVQLNFNASVAHPIYGASETVQPPAFVVNVWRRTA